MSIRPEQSSEDFRRDMSRIHESIARLRYAVSPRQDDADQRAFDELVARGRDPDNPKRFRGRIECELRCAGPSHGLADVYPTREGPALVPWAFSSSDREFRRKEKPKERREHIEEWRTGILADCDDPALAERIIRGLIDPAFRQIPRDGQPFRYTWDLENSKRSISGMILLTPARLATWASPGYEGAAFAFLCRCGRRSISCSKLVEVVESGASRFYI